MYATVQVWHDGATTKAPASFDNPAYPARTGEGTKKQRQSLDSNMHGPLNHLWPLGEPCAGITQVAPKANLCGAKKQAVEHVQSITAYVEIWKKCTCTPMYSA